MVTENHISQIKKAQTSCKYGHPYPDDAPICKGGRVCPQCSRERSLRYYHQNMKAILRKYALSQEDYDALLEKQNGVCAICHLPERKKSSKRLCIDHDHETDIVRGLLCHACNAAIGLLEDDVDRLAQAVIYLGGFCAEG